MEERLRYEPAIIAGFSIGGAMTLRTTKKSVEENFCKIYGVGYYRLDSLLRYEKPVAHLRGPKGWKCDIYNLGDGIALATGHEPIGKRINSNLTTKYNLMAKQANHDYATIKELIKQFKEEI